MKGKVAAGGPPIHPPCGDGNAPALCLSRLFLPAGGKVFTADPSPENLCWLAAHHPGVPVEAMERGALLKALRQRHGAALLEEAVSGLAQRLPQLSARQVISNGQGAVLIWSALLFTAAAMAAPMMVLCVVIAVLSVLFVAGGLFRGVLALFGAKPIAATAPSHLALPGYTLLVPLYREAAMLPGLAAALAALDYPRDRLDILLAVEEDDEETVRAAEALAFATVARVPPGGPRTKPKAANYALQFARGDYVVVYDAEDRPEPDQLLKAVAAFRASPRTVACLQARLNFYNAQRNWLTNGIMAQTPQAV